MSLSEEQMKVRTEARNELIEAIELILKTGNERGLCDVSADNSRALAALLLDQLSMHVTMKVLSGMAATQ